MSKHATLTTDQTFTGANTFDQTITTNGGVYVNDGGMGCIYLMKMQAHQTSTTVNGLITSIV